MYDYARFTQSGRCGISARLHDGAGVQQRRASHCGFQASPHGGIARAVARQRQVHPVRPHGLDSGVVQWCGFRTGVPL